MGDAAREANEKREANAERRHEETIEEGRRQHRENVAETRKGREQEAGFRREEIDLARRRVEAGEQQGAEINELRQGLTAVTTTVNNLAQTVEEQGEKQGQDMAELKALIREAFNRG